MLTPDVAGGGVVSAAAGNCAVASAAGGGVVAAAVGGGALAGAAVIDADRCVAAAATVDTAAAAAVAFADGARDSEIVAGIQEIAGLLLSKERIAVLTHNSVDGDTLGSGLAVCRALLKLNKSVSLIHEEGFPEHLSDLLNDRSFFLSLPDDEAKVFDVAWDAVVIFDTADRKLLGKRGELLDKTDCAINIDHHFTNKRFGHYNLIDPTASSTAEVAYNLLVSLNVPLDYDIALAIYAGICTDTGGFSFSNTTSASHEIAAHLLRFGLDVAYLRYKFFDSITLSKLHCQAYAANALKLYGDGKYALVVVPAAALSELGSDEADCEGLVNIGRNIEGVEVSVFAREVRAGVFRINLRSRGRVDVSDIARKFNGGGHIRAAGCTVMADAADIEAVLLGALGCL